MQRDQGVSKQRLFLGTVQNIYIIYYKTPINVIYASQQIEWNQKIDAPCLGFYIYVDFVVN